MPAAIREKIRVDPDGHWQWTGHVNPAGYGMTFIENSVRPPCGVTPAHRAVYAILRDTPGENLHHECGVKSCVNPDHCEPLTIGEHTSEHRTKDRCIRGHDLSDSANVYVFTRTGKTKPERQCSRCISIRQMAIRAADAAARGLDPDPEARRRRSKLTESQVLEVWRMRGERSAVEVAARFGVGRQTVYAIWAGRNWAWLTRPGA